jgi:glycosyltransferase involved in cell wall biosynthesis
VIGDAGLIFPEGDVAALVAALYRLQSDASLRRELAERGRQRALEKFSSVALADDFYAFCLGL